MVGQNLNQVFIIFFYHSILHTWTLLDRHKQTGTIENLNRQIGRVIMIYLTNKNLELGYKYLEWTDIVDELRHNLNDAKNTH
jgi:hypothetical protein